MAADHRHGPDDWIDVEVAYARPDRQWLIALRVQAGTTARAAVEQSGLLDDIPELDIDAAGVGIFAEPVSAETPLAPGDRVEVYRPLQIDPKAQRRHRARAQRHTQKR